MTTLDYLRTAWQHLTMGDRLLFCLWSTVAIGCAALGVWCIWDGMR